MDSTVAETSIDLDALTEDEILGGQLRLLQPRHGYRAGMDAVLLAASVPAEAGQAVLVETNFALDDEVWLEPTPDHTPGHVLEDGDAFRFRFLYTVFCSRRRQDRRSRFETRRHLCIQCPALARNGPDSP